MVTDSHTAPLRRGATSIGIGFWGFHTVNHHTGKKDIVGREMLLSATNLVDAVSGAATVVGGELDECTPLCIARDVPHVRFTKQDTRHELLVAPEDDIYSPLLKPFFEKHP